MFVMYLNVKKYWVFWGGLGLLLFFCLFVYSSGYLIKGLQVPALINGSKLSSFSSDQERKDMLRILL